MRHRYQTGLTHILVLVLLVGTGVKAQRSSAAGTAESHYQKGIELLEKQQLESAIAKLLAATRLKPRFADAYKALGIAQARKGGWGQPLGLNDDPSNFSVSCRQTGPIDVDLSKLGENEEVFSQKTSIFFKTTRIYRLVDKPRNTLVYLAISTKIINGSPANAISTVPIMQWPTR